MKTIKRFILPEVVYKGLKDFDSIIYKGIKFDSGLLQFINKPLIDREIQILEILKYQDYIVTENIGYDNKEIEDMFDDLGTVEDITYKVTIDDRYFYLAMYGEDIVRIDNKVYGVGTIRDFKEKLLKNARRVKLEKINSFFKIMDDIETIFKWYYTELGYSTYNKTIDGKITKFMSEEEFDNSNMSKCYNYCVSSSYRIKGRK